MGNIRTISLSFIAVVMLSASSFAGFLPNTVNCNLGVTPQNGNPPLTVTANGNCQEFNSQGAPVPLTITIDWGDGTAVTNGTTGQHTYPAGANTYTVTIKGVDAQQQQGTATQTVTVNNSPPTCTVNVTPTTGPAPLTVSANANCTDPDQNISLEQIDWGDGTISSDTSSGTHTYNSPGVYTVTATAFDSFEASGSGSQNVTVTNAAALYVAGGDGKILGIQTDGSISQTLDTKISGTVTGMYFDFNGNLFVTNFTSGNLSVFSNSDKAGAARINEISSFFSVSQFGSGYNCQPESVTEDSKGNVFVGLAGCNKNVLKFDPSGKSLASYAVEIEDQGADWIDLAADDCTLFYTSEGHKVLRYNVCGNRQLSDFAGGFHKALAVKLLPDGGVLVADNVDIHRTDINGKITNTYDTPGNDCWSAVAVGADGTSFYATDACTSQVVQFDLASGSVLQTIRVKSGTGTMYGLVDASFSPNFLSVGSSPSSGTTTNGSATFSISVGFGGSARLGQTSGSGTTSLALYCSNLPVGAKCSFNPPAVAVNGSPSTLTITTNNATVSDGRAHDPLFARPSFVAILGLLSISFGAVALPRRRNYRKWFWTGFVVCTALFLIACGTHSLSNQTITAGPIGVPQPGNTPAGTYTINVNAGNGQQVSSTSISLTVK